MPSYQYAAALMVVYAAYARGDLLGAVLSDIGNTFGTTDPAGGMYHCMAHNTCNPDNHKFECKQPTMLTDVRFFS